MEQASGGPRKVRRRSRPHPKVDAGQCVQLARTVQQYGGVMGVEDYAQAIGYTSHTTGAVVAKIASPGYFGLLRREGNELRTTDLLSRILTPISDEELGQAKAEALMNVGIYRDLLDAVGRTGRKKNEVVKAIAQRRLGIEAVAAEEFLQTFVASMEWAGLAASEDDGFVLQEQAGVLDELAPERQEEGASRAKMPDRVPPSQSSSEQLTRRMAIAAPGIHLHLHVEGLSIAELKDILQAFKDELVGLEED